MGKKHAKNGWYLRSLKDSDGVYRSYKVLYRKGQITRKILAKKTGLINLTNELTDVELNDYIADEEKAVAEYDKNALYDMAEDEKNHYLTLLAEKDRRDKAELQSIQKKIVEEAENNIKDHEEHLAALVANKKQVKNSDPRKRETIDFYDDQIRTVKSKIESQEAIIANAK